MQRPVLASALATLAVLLGLELLCRLLPVSTATETDYRVDPLVRTYPPHHRWTTSTGWDLRRPQAMTANNEGFAAEHDFVRNPQAVALIGDSYVEASMLPMPQRLAHRLEVALGGARPVYAMGNPGTSLLDYAERIRLAHQRYDVRDMVLLVEAGDVMQSFCGSGNVEGVCLDPRSGGVIAMTLPAASRAKQWLRQSAFAQYLVSQLRFDPARLWQQVMVQSDTAASSPSERPVTAEKAVGPRLAAVDQVLAAFLARIQGHVPGRLVMLLDGRRGAARPGRLWPPQERDRFAQGLRAAGAVVVDLEPAYAVHQSGSVLRLDVSPSDAHLNAVGLDLVAQAAAPALLAVASAAPFSAR